MFIFKVSRKPFITTAVVINVFFCDKGQRRGACVPVLVFVCVCVCVCVRATSICDREKSHSFFLIFVCVCACNREGTSQHKFVSGWEIVVIKAFDSVKYKMIQTGERTLFCVRVMEKTSTGFCCGSRAVIPLRLEVTMGKTCALEVLAEALSETDIKHVILRINPKAITAAQMFGNLDPTTGDWTMTVSAGGLY